MNFCNNNFKFSKVFEKNAVKEEKVGLYCHIKKKIMKGVFQWVLILTN